jgi:hypothetical protein
MKKEKPKTVEPVLDEREKIVKLLEEIARSNRQIARRLDELARIRAAVDYSAELNEIKLGVFAIKDFHQSQRA